VKVGVSVLVLSVCVLRTLAQLHASEDGTGAVDKQAFRRAEAVLANHETELLTIPGVVGVGIGLTEQGGQPVIHVYVNVKATGGTIPAAIPQQVKGVPIRIIQTGEVKAQE
jgi:hypothetical protein